MSAYITVNGTFQKIAFESDKLTIANVVANTYAKGQGKDGKDYVNTYYSAVIFGERGKIFKELFSEGDPLIISGEFRAAPWEKDGKTGMSLNINVSQFARPATKFEPKAKKKTEDFD